MIFSKLRSIARKQFIPSWTVPILLLTLVVLSYGLRALSLGFFWDDLPYLWFFHRLGADGILTAFTQDRPFLSLIYTTTLNLFGNSSQAWQMFALVSRWLCSLGLWWVLTLVWPRHSHIATWTAILFTVYPGFTQQWIAVIYGQAFLLFACTFFSIGISLWMLRQHKLLKSWMIFIGIIVSLGLSAFSMFSTEYFFGLELLRPILLWVILSEIFTTRSHHFFWRKVRLSTIWWFPYLVLMVFFVIWRGFIHVFPAASFSTLQNISETPWAAVQNLGLTILGDLVESAIAAWGQPLQLAGILEDSTFGGLRLLAIILVTGTLCSIYLAMLRPSSNDESDAAEPPTSRPVPAIIVGVLTLIIAGWPFWITGLPMRLGFPQDRYTLPLAPGICLIGAGLIDYLGGVGRSQLWRKAVVIGIAVGLSSGFHNNLALNYRKDLETMRNFFWQLTWRAPAVQPGTLFLTSDMPFLYYEDDSLSAPLNWTFDPVSKTNKMDYILFDLQIRRQSLTDLSPGRPIQKDFRATTFEGTTSQALVVFYNPPGCVHVLDPQYDSEIYRLPDWILRALPLSNPQKWITDSPSPAVPPIDLMGSEPKRRWCYYYQKAELARQKQDWQSIVDLEDQSIQVGLRPNDPSEYLPFIEGYARTGKLDDAIEMTQSTYLEARDLQPALCAIWQRSSEAGIEIGDKRRKQIQNILLCPIP